MRAALLILTLGLTTLAGVQGWPAARAADVLASPAQATFTVPKDWTDVKAPGLDRIRAPEQDFEIAIIPVGPARDAADALARGWAIYRPGAAPTAGGLTPFAPGNGWEEARAADYARSPGEHALTRAQALRRGASWTVVVLDGALATAAKRGSGIAELTQSLRAPGFVPESFAGRKAHGLDPAAVETLLAFLRGAMKDLDIPGVGVAMIDHGKVVWEGGLGVRDVSTGAPVDAHTRFMIASNTKGMTTLLLAKLVDEGKLDWDQKVTSIYPDFRLADPEVTARVRVRHLICACTGLPRKDVDWGLTGRYDTPASETFRLLSLTRPTSGFGEVFQYNNVVASAAGYVAAYRVHPELELGQAYDRLMQAEIFDPLGMKDTTFDFHAAQSGDHATGHAEAFDGALARVRADANDAIHAFRPAGAAWSTPHDMLIYVRNELDEGVTPDGRRLFSRANLLKRREGNVKVGLHGMYGMGLMVDDVAGVPVVHHGGSLPGYMSDWYAIPSAGVGVVLLTNADSGEVLLRPFERRLMEVLYDGRPEAQAQLAAAVAQRHAVYDRIRNGASTELTAEIKARLAPAYDSSVGALLVKSDDKGLVFEIGGRPFHVAWRRAADGTLSFMMVEPGLVGTEFTQGQRNGKPVLVITEGANEYVFTARDS